MHGCEILPTSEEAKLKSYFLKSTPSKPDIITHSTIDNGQGIMKKDKKGSKHKLFGTVLALIFFFLVLVLITLIRTVPDLFPRIK